MADKNTGLKEYGYSSRYASRPIYADDKGNTYHGIGKWLKDNSTSVYTCVQGDTLEKIAYQQYGSPILWWIIADINRMVDPAEELKEGQTLKMLPMGDIEWYTRF